MNIKNNLISFVGKTVLIGASGFSSVINADFLRSIMSKNVFFGIVCDINARCWSKASIGVSKIPFCAERISWIQPLKPYFGYVAKSFYKIGRYPEYFFNLRFDNPINTVFKATLEELLCRGLFQKGLFREVPRYIISKISPKNADIVDHYIAKIFQITAASIIFGLLHADRWECKKGGTIPEIAAGIIYGVIAETRYGLVWSSAAHTFANCLFLSREL